jgi:hypothetical protein
MIRQHAAMPWNKDAVIQSLRLTYNAAVSAHLACSRALTEATSRGDIPTLPLVEAEQKAKVRLEEVRAKLHRAMVSAISGADTT